MNASERIAYNTATSAIMHTLPYFLVSGLPATALISVPDAPLARIAAFGLAALGTAYLRYQYKGLRNNFNSAAGAPEKIADDHPLHRLSHSLNYRREEDLKLSENDLNPMKHPYMMAFSVAVGIATNDSSLGLACYAKTMAIKELAIFTRVKFEALLPLTKA